MEEISLRAGVLRIVLTKYSEYEERRNEIMVTKNGSRGKGELSSNKKCLTWGEGRRR